MWELGKDRAWGEMWIVTFTGWEILKSVSYIYASEFRSRSGCGRPRVGVGGL